MMGYKIYKTHIELRKRNWKRARRAFLRFKPNDIHLARRVISYCGLIKHTDYVNADKIYQIKQKANLARKAVSNESKIQRTTA